MLDDVGTTVYTYTPGGFLATESGPFGDDAVTNYYSNRLRIGFGLQEPAGAWTNGFGYDAIVRLGADATWLKARHNPAQGKGASAWPPSASLAWVAARETSSPVRAAYPLARLASPFYHAPSGLGCKGNLFLGRRSRTRSTPGWNISPRCGSANDLSGSLEGAGGIGGLLERADGYNPTNGTWTNHNYYHADGNGNITYLESSSQMLAASGGGLFS